MAKSKTTQVPGLTQEEKETLKSAIDKTMPAELAAIVSMGEKEAHEAIAAIRDIPVLEEWAGFVDGDLLAEIEEQLFALREIASKDHEEQRLEAVKEALSEDPVLLAATKLHAELVETPDLAALLTRVEQESDIAILRACMRLVSDCGSDMYRALEDRRSLLLRQPEITGLDTFGDRILSQGLREIEVLLSAEERLLNLQVLSAKQEEQTAEIADQTRRLASLKDNLKLTQRHIVMAINDATGIRTVPTCTVVRGKEAVTYRTDTLEIIIRRPANPGELQEPLLAPLPKPKAPVEEKPVEEVAEPEAEKAIEPVTDGPPF